MAMEYAKALYKSKAWRECRKSFMVSRNHICERCGDMADVVHHRKHISPANIMLPSITLCWDNLQALCQTCHAIVHGFDQVCREDVQFDEYGQLVPRVCNGTGELLHERVESVRR